MKICPKCQSTYSDETLNYCLTDGTILLSEEESSSLAGVSREWHNAETLFDDRLVKSDSANRTFPLTGSSTSPAIQAETTSFPQKKNPFLYPVIGIIAVLLLTGGFWWFNKNSSNPVTKQSTTGNTSIDYRPPVVPLTQEQETRVKKEVTDFIESWRASNEKKDIEAHIAHYADTLEYFYKESGVDKNNVRADRLRPYQRYDTIGMQVDNLKVMPESENSAVAIFDKTWTLKNAQKTSTGSVQQELRFVKHDGKWLITGEKDVKVYYINNRENQPDANANQESNKVIGNK